LSVGAQRRVACVTEACLNVDLLLLAVDVFRAYRVAVDRPQLVFGEQDRDLGADARTRRTVGLAVRWILDADLFVRRHAVDVEQAEGQALHAVGAAPEVDDGKPRLPAARPSRSG